MHHHVHAYDVQHEERRNHHQCMIESKLNEEHTNDRDARQESVHDCDRSSGCFK